MVRGLVQDELRPSSWTNQAPPPIGAPEALAMLAAVATTGQALLLHHHIPGLTLDKISPHSFQSQGQFKQSSGSAMRILLISWSEWPSFLYSRPWHLRLGPPTKSLCCTAKLPGPPRGSPCRGEAESSGTPNRRDQRRSLPTCQRHGPFQDCLLKATEWDRG